MRPFAILFVILLIVAAQTRAMEWDTFSINKNPVPATALVSFSIGYPKGWRVSENPSLQRRDIYFDVSFPVYDTPDICSFSESVLTNEPHPQHFTGYTLWRSDSVTAREAAEKFLADMRPSGPCRDGRISAVKTGAGDSGWLVAGTGYLVYYPSLIFSKNIVPDMAWLIKNHEPGEKIPVVYHEFFFRSETPGNQAGIRIEIMTSAADSCRLVELDHLVLQTLRFNNP